jgi:hypothetical protein
VLNSAEPVRNLVPTAAVLVHQIFNSAFGWPQIAESRRGDAGSNKPISVERDSVEKEQLLESLPLFERSLHPEIGGARQNPFSEWQEAFHVEFSELAGVTFHPNERELLAQPIARSFVRFEIDRSREDECLIEPIELPLNRFGLPRHPRAE